MACGTSLLLAALFAVVFCAAVPTKFDIPTSALRNGGQIYAVLVAGSSGWFNYRHQASTETEVVTKLKLVRLV